MSAHLYLYLSTDTYLSIVCVYTSYPLNYCDPYMAGRLGGKLGASAKQGFGSST